MKIIKTEYRIIPPEKKGAEQKLDEIEVEIKETCIFKRKVSLGALDSATDMMKNALIKSKETTKDYEKDIARNTAERDKLAEVINKSIKKVIKK